MYCYSSLLSLIAKDQLTITLRNHDSWLNSRLVFFVSILNAAAHLNQLFLSGFHLQSAWSKHSLSCACVENHGLLLLAF